MREVVKAPEKMMLSLVFRAMLVLMVLSIFSGCDGNVKTGSEAVVNGYTLIDSGMWSMPVVYKGIYWIDNLHVLFTGRQGAPGNGIDDTEKLMVWNYSTGDKYLLNHDGVSYCYRNNKLWFYRLLKPDDKSSRHIYSADFVLNDQGKYMVTEAVIRGENDKRLDATCHIVGRSQEYDNLHVLSEYDLVLRPIDNESEEYEKNKRLGFYADEQLVKILPIRERKITAWLTYVPTRDIYFFTTGVQPDDTKPGRSPWPKDKRRLIYYFNRDLELNRILLPDDWLNNDRSLFFWAKPGFVASGHAILSNKETEGLYLLKSNDVELLLKGRAFGGVLAENGCYLAFSHEPGAGLYPVNSRNKRTVKVIDVCEKKE